MPPGASPLSPPYTCGAVPVIVVGTSSPHIMMIGPGTYKVDGHVLEVVRRGALGYKLDGDWIVMTETKGWIYGKTGRRVPQPLASKVDMFLWGQTFSEPDNDEDDEK